MIPGMKGPLHLPRAPQNAGFRLTKFSVGWYCNGFTCWHFAGNADALGAIISPHFFDEARELIAIGDHVHITAKDGAAVAVFCELKRGGLQAVPMCATRWVPE